jgi:hypothetical protein
MASDDKKIKTNPPSKNEAAPKNKSTQKMQAYPRLRAANRRAIVGARGRNRFPKLIKITGT